MDDRLPVLIDPLGTTTADLAVESIDEADIAGIQGKNPHAAALGRLGGKKGGPARASKLSAERRSEIARLAARARWARRIADE